MPERLVTLMRFERRSQAEYMVERLVNAGIEPTVQDERSGEPPTPDTLPLGGGPVLLQVPESRAKEAGEILQEGFDEDMGDINPQIG
jgi:hypothetical protein